MVSIGNPSCSSSSSGCPSSPVDPYVRFLQNDSSLDGLDALLSNKAFRRTFQLLSRVVESRVSVDWTLPLIEYRRHRSTSGYHGNSTCATVDEKVHRTENRTPESISNSTKTFVVDLVNTFESRYADGYQSLVADALRVYASSTSNSTTATTSPSSTSSSDETEADLSPSSPFPAPQATMNARARYIGILQSLFVQQINWGRIVAMLTFLRALCEVLEDATHHSQLASEDENEPPSQPIDKTDFVPMFNQLSVSEVSTTSQTDGGGGTKLPRRDQGMTSLHYLVWTAEFIHKESNLGDWIEEHGSWEGLESFSQSGKPSVSQLTSLLFGVSALLLGPVGFASAIAFVLRRFWSR